MTSISAVPFCDLDSLHTSISGELKDAFERVVRGKYLILGPEVESFEHEFAAYCGSRFCITVGNGLDALALVLRAHQIGEGDEVIVPAQTFIATWLAVTMVGATPVPVDISPQTYNLDPARVKDRLTDNTRAIIPVHLYGQPADMDAIREVTMNRPHILLLEDAAQAHGAIYKKRRTGSLGDAAAFSFYPTKNLGCLGDGGGITTDSSVLASQLKRLRNYGSSQKYIHELQGINTRLDEMQAAFLRVKLRYLDDWNSARSMIARLYTKELSNVGDLVLPPCVVDGSHVFHLYVVATRHRDELLSFLNLHNVAALVHYPTPPYLQEAYIDYASLGDTLQNSASAAETTLSLPIWPGMKQEQVYYVTKIIRRFFSSSLQ